ncbi:hypothetical protein JI739_11345 [Ramlibacter sp. AW1]|uniref:Outer membrane protein OmpA-like transmembrane domain-containing protein n=1 Tax=Ramlibacter aurantiacus TaxID=2801330 RepID=A0A936ZHD3_9BURK|nr:outer membrane beta-barrel protein [Ramlibacter aurantiacus]MBL0420942.1 hypothetical protein [Ramlibacter aurantiacus]
MRLLPACILCILTGGAWAQSGPEVRTAQLLLKPGVESESIGLQIGRSSYGMRCTAPGCEPGDPAMRLWSRGMWSPRWGAELGLVDTGRLEFDGGLSRAQGVNFSLVRRFSIMDSLSAYGKLGTTYGQSATTAGLAQRQGAGSGFGLSYGAALNWDFSPTLSASLEWENHDFRFSTGDRGVRSTSLGLQWRY